MWHTIWFYTDKIRFWSCFMNRLVNFNQTVKPALIAKYHIRYRYNTRIPLLVIPQCHSGLFTLFDTESCQCTNLLHCFCDTLFSFAYLYFCHWASKATFFPKTFFYICNNCYNVIFVLIQRALISNNFL